MAIVQQRQVRDAFVGMRIVLRSFERYGRTPKIAPLFDGTDGPEPLATPNRTPLLARTSPPVGSAPSLAEAGKAWRTVSLHTEPDVGGVSS